MNRRKFLQASTCTLGAALLARPYLARAATRELLVAEPQHGTGYLPLYIAMANGYFDDAGVSVKIITIETGAGHTNAVLSGDAFAFIGGPEHNAFAKLRGAELRAIVNCVDRNNNYLSAATGLAPVGTDYASFVKGKSIACGPFSGTPNSTTRYLLAKWGLDAKRDVTLHEMPASAVLPAVKSGQAQIGVANEPNITQGVRIRVWNEPFYNAPKELGPYAYSTINVRLDSIRKEPELTRGFVRGILKGIKFLYAERDGTAEIAKRQFPTMALDDLKATLERSFADEMWTRDGTISRAAWTSAQAVVRQAGILKADVPYDDIIDMSFVESLHATL
jgi:NitT/TauT family transport system substrate-binding protein